MMDFYGVRKALSDAKTLAETLKKNLAEDLRIAENGDVKDNGILRFSILKATDK